MLRRRVDTVQSIPAGKGATSRPVQNPDISLERTLSLQRRQVRWRHILSSARYGAHTTSPLIVSVDHPVLAPNQHVRVVTVCEK